jgi:exopolysaccharide biosynthesis protein
VSPFGPPPPPPDAINLDGGGSATMVVGGKVVNSPSDNEGERPVADSLEVVP